MGLFNNSFSSCLVYACLQPDVVEPSEIERIAMISEKHDLTATQVKAYKETFDRLDLDGNGSLDMGEVRNAMYFWGQNLTDGELLAFFNKYDKDNNAVITFDEYLVMFIEKVGKSEKEAEYAAKFKALDKNQDGFLSEDELKEGLVNEFEDIIDGDQEDLEQLMREVNKNKDGQLNYLDFIKALRYKGLMQ